jgi:hypothetical protein
MDPNTVNNKRCPFMHYSHLCTHIHYKLTLPSRYASMASLLQNVKLKQRYFLNPNPNSDTNTISRRTSSTESTPIYTLLQHYLITSFATILLKTRPPQCMNKHLAGTSLHSLTSRLKVSLIHLASSGVHSQ